MQELIIQLELGVFLISTDNILQPGMDKVWDQGALTRKTAKNHDVSVNGI